MIREEGMEQKGEGDKQGTRKPVRGRGKCQNKGITDLAEELLAIQVASDSSEDSDTTCPKCGLRFPEDSGTTWIACNSCHQWYNLSCTKIKNQKKEKRGRNKKGEVDKQGTRKPVRGRGKCQNKGITDLAEELLAIQVASDSSEDSDTTCPKCGLRFSEDSGTTWIACNSCHQWYNLSCTKIKNRKKNIPSCFYCENCV